MLPTMEASRVQVNSSFDEYTAAVTVSTALLIIGIKIKPANSFETLLLISNPLIEWRKISALTPMDIWTISSIIPAIGIDSVGVV